jgi:hypothetical protein
MTNHNFKRGYRSIASLTTALLISTSTAMVFAAETATIEQDVVTNAAIVDASVSDLGRFTVTPKSATFVSASRK